MNKNYTYIIASTPALDPSFRPSGDSVKSTVEWIVSQLDGKDAAGAALVKDGFCTDKLDREFYERAFKSGIPFIRDYFGADLRLRNAKVRYLNSQLGRPDGTDVMEIEGAPRADDAGRINAVFAEKDLLAREKAIDDFLWETADSLTLFKWFRLENVLAIIVKLLIIERWMALDEEKGRELLRSLVTGVRGTYGKIEFNTLK